MIDGCSDTLKATQQWSPRMYAILWLALASACPLLVMLKPLFEAGFVWWQCLVIVAPGSILAAAFSVYNGRIGATYRVDTGRASSACFGVRGAQLVAVLRLILLVILSGWYLNVGAKLFQGSLLSLPIGFERLPNVFPAGWPLTSGLLVSIVAVWLLSLAFSLIRPRTLHWFLLAQAIILPLFVAFMAVYRALQSPPDLLQSILDNQHFGRDFWLVLTTAIQASVFWLPLALNINDYTHFAVSPRAPEVSQWTSIPIFTTVFGMVGYFIHVANAAKPTPNPEQPQSLFDLIMYNVTAVVLLFSLLLSNFCITTLPGSKIWSFLGSRTFTFRRGALLTAFLTLFLLPFGTDQTGFIFDQYPWVMASFSAPILAIMLVDYYAINQQHVASEQLSIVFGQYWFRNGFNAQAFIALFAGMLTYVPGLLYFADVWVNGVSGVQFRCSWVLGMAVSGGVYWIGMRFFAERWSWISQEDYELRSHAKSYSDINSTIQFTDWRRSNTDRMF